MTHLESSIYSLRYDNGDVSNVMDCMAVCEGDERCVGITDVPGWGCCITKYSRWETGTDADTSKTFYQLYRGDEGTVHPSEICFDLRLNK